MSPFSFARHQFPPTIIQHAIWLYLRFTLSYRDVEELLAERGVEVSYETVRRWVLKFGPAIARTLRRLRDSGLIELNGQRITVNDVRQLASVGQFDELYLHLIRAPRRLERTFSGVHHRNGAGMDGEIRPKA